MFSDLYSDLANTFNEWLENTPTGGDYVTNLTVDYANRAQDSLWSDPPNGWSLLTRSTQLTITNLVATLPSGCGKLINIYSDEDQDKKPNRYYFKDGGVINGFKFIPAFAKATGHSTTIQFYQAPVEPVFCDYQVKLDAFSGSGTEYLFFPKNLMFCKMQELRCLDKGMLKEWDAISVEFNRELDRFKSQHQNPVEMPGIVINDFNGNEVFIPKYNLSSGLGYGGRMVGSTNDRDVYRI
ncbi:MAG: hypothetical protein JXB48_21190 [Candidatus Latescibacteria bacterium]|nr:hypothetical protein [Candidatus Latescibacterota bacterium]